MSTAQSDRALFGPARTSHLPRDKFKAMRQRCKSIASLVSVLTAVALPAKAELDPKSDVLGLWHGPIGEVLVQAVGDTLEGRMAATSPSCAFAQGEVVLRGNLIAGSLAGSLRLCLKECGSGDSELWAFSMLVVDGERMAGATHVPPSDCRVPGRGENGAVVFSRTRPDGSPFAALPIGPQMPAGVYDPRGRTEPRERALDEARAGAALLGQGRFEAARGRFRAAVAIDPDYAEGYNGIGVTHALRREWDEAILWYRRSIAAGPFIGDAYYNLACAYAQREEPELAVRYLRLSVLNGYAQLQHLTVDPDLAPLRGREDFLSVLGLGAAAPAASAPPAGDDGPDGSSREEDESRGQ